MTYEEVYKRFKDNYKTDFGGLNLYPQFDSDLEILLDRLDKDYCAGYLLDEVE